ncbi:electron transfer flavoprotein subunit alpha/FixB family protein [Leeia oryzae]|uniref:electron transfer flavoprotein subunit alpha/FixB family protein n=1 Tax=Leeia oryzae TaxID=356662 RepID=UPI00035F408D|nr:FAD-binding protein [Leeia oryzae]
MNALVIAEVKNKEVKLSTHATITAALKVSQQVDVLVMGDDVAAATSLIASLAGVRKVLGCTDGKFKHLMGEDVASVVVSIAKAYQFIFAPANVFGKDFMPRVAAKLDVSQVSDVVDIIDQKTFVRPIYAGNAFITVESSDEIKLVTIRTTSFSTELANVAPVTIEQISTPALFAKKEVLSVDEIKNDRPELNTAKVVVSGGRGLGSKENFDGLLIPLADKLKAALGASRAAVDAGYVQNDLQVGQTGKIVAPELYIAIGISGAIQHLAGMKDSKVIVAINKDKDAPIFSIADYGLVGDLNEVIPALTARL